MCLLLVCWFVGVLVGWGSPVFRSRLCADGQERVEQAQKALEQVPPPMQLGESAWVSSEHLGAAQSWLYGWVLASPAGLFWGQYGKYYFRCIAEALPVMFALVQFAALNESFVCNVFEVLLVDTSFHRSGVHQRLWSRAVRFTPIKPFDGW